MMNLPEDFSFSGLPSELELEDKWLINKFNKLAKEVSENLDKYELGVASQKIYDFIAGQACVPYLFKRYV